MIFSNEPMTDEEKQLLTEAFIDKQRIQSRRLLDYQKEALMHLRGAKSYLCEKYPEQPFHLRIFLPVSNETPFASLIFTREGEDFPVYTVFIQEKHGTLTFTDSYKG